MKKCPYCRRKIKRIGNTKETCGGAVCQRERHLKIMRARGKYSVNKEEHALLT